MTAILTGWTRQPTTLSRNGSKAQVERFIATEKNIHSRGVYYACVSAGGVVKPDGDPFTGTATTP